MSEFYARHPLSRDERIRLAALRAIASRRARAERENAARQLAEDTCEEHGVFVCPICFDTSEAES